MFSLIILFLILLCCSAFFSGSETAMFSLSSVQMRQIGERAGHSGSKLIAALREPRKLLVTILLGNELVNVCISIVGASMIGRVFHGSAATQTIAAVVIITPIILVFGEILPKNAALSHARQLAPVIIWPLDGFYKLVRPLRAVLTFIADKVVILFGGEPKKTKAMIMEDEFRRLIDLGSEKGVIVEEERDLIHNVFDFSDKVVREIMTPLERVYFLPVDMPYDQMIEGIREVQFSRIPVYEENRDNVIGVMHVKDLFAFHRRRILGKTEDIRTLLHPPLFIASSTPLEELLKEFQRTHLHMAMVKDISGKPAGIITMDDILQELFGKME